MCVFRWGFYKIFRILHFLKFLVSTFETRYFLLDTSLKKIIWRVRVYFNIYLLSTIVATG